MDNSEIPIHAVTARPPDKSSGNHLFGRVLEDWGRRGILI